MKRYRIRDLQDAKNGHILQGILPGECLTKGGLSFSKPLERSHTKDGPGGSDYHVHEDECEAFIILQGKGEIEINKSFYPISVGDVLIVEPLEDHHLISDASDPLVVVWCHANER